MAMRIGQTGCNARNAHASPAWGRSGEQDNGVWSFRLDHARVAGRTDRIELKYNESWESKVA